MTFVGGKGGVGKTTIAAAAAIRSAARGRRTLLVSTDPAHSTSDVLEVRLASTPTPVLPNLDALEIDPAEEADRYIADVKRHVAGATPPHLAAEVDRQIDIARVSPGADEAAVFDRFTRILDTAGGAYERICFDTAPLGHTLRLLALPEQMQAWMRGMIGHRRRAGAMGRMWRRVAGGVPTPPVADDDAVLGALEARGERFRRARDLLTDPARAGFLFVLVPERLPILETARAVETLRRHAVPVLGLVVNRVLPPDADGAFLAQHRLQEADYLAEIDRTFGALPRWTVPLFPRDVVGPSALRRVAEGLDRAVD